MNVHFFCNSKNAPEQITVRLGAKLSSHIQGHRKVLMTVTRHANCAIATAVPTETHPTSRERSSSLRGKRGQESLAHCVTEFRPLSVREVCTKTTWC